MRIELDESNDLLPHYNFDYSKASPNRFAEAYKKRVTLLPLDDNSDGNQDEPIATGKPNDTD